jgi:hypothetical protein
MRLHRKKKGGTNTVELAPALFILLIVVLIPCIDILHIGLAYAFGWYANFLATREVACVGPNPPAPMTPQSVADTATAAWANSGLGQFVHAPPPVNVVNASYPPDIDGDGKNDFCQVTTTVQVLPMFRMPFGPTTPISFTYCTVRPLEEKDIK